MKLLQIVSLVGIFPFLVNTVPLSAQQPEEHPVSTGHFSAKWELDAKVLPANPGHVLFIPKSQWFQGGQDPRMWQALTVLDAVEYGATVKKGETLLKLDLEQLEKRISAMEKSQVSTELRLRSAEQELVHMEKTIPEDLERARRENRIAQEEWTYFDKTSRANEQKQAEFNLKNSKQGLEYAEEELRQLEKMYKSDELTEETEEIVLRRSRHSVERSRFNLDQVRENTKRSLEVFIPRREENLKKTAQLSALSLANAEKTLPAALEQKRRDVEKMRVDTADAATELVNLKEDHKALSNLTAPIDGTAFFGRWTPTQAGQGGESATRFQAGARIAARETLMTVVPKGNSYCLAATIPEDRHGEFIRVQSSFAEKKMQLGFAILRCAPDSALAVKSVILGNILVAGSYPVRIEVEEAKGVPLTAGLQAKVVLFEEKHDNVIAVPDRFVQSEPTIAGTRYFVYVKSKDAEKNEKRMVKPARSYGGQSLILDGLIEGEVLSMKSDAPKPPPKPKADDVPHKSDAKPEAKPDTKPEQPPPKPDAKRDGASAMRRGIDFLLSKQARDGHWGDPTDTTGMDIYAPEPGSHHAFRAATTALCVKALTECGSGDAKVEKALDRAQKWMLKELPKVRRAQADVIYNNWAHLYGIRGLVALHHRAGKRGDKRAQEKLVGCIREQVAALGRYEFLKGGWGYYDFEAHTQKPSDDSPTFMTGSALIALDEARDLGVEVPEKLVQRALATLRRQRNPDGSYFYGEQLRYRPRSGINRPAGSLGRSQTCNAALRLWGDPIITDDVLREWLDRLIVRQGWLDIGRKRPIPHEAWFQIAGYFYYYGHFYAGECIQLLPTSDRPKYQEQLANLILATQEKNGSWWDFPMYSYHEPYGTAYALMTLQRCGVELPSTAAKAVR